MIIKTAMGTTTERTCSQASFQCLRYAKKFEFLKQGAQLQPGGDFMHFDVELHQKLDSFDERPRKVAETRRLKSIARGFWRPSSPESPSIIYIDINPDNTSCSALFS